MKQQNQHNLPPYLFQTAMGGGGGGGAGTIYGGISVYPVGTILPPSVMNFINSIFMTHAPHNYYDEDDDEDYVEHHHHLFEEDFDDDDDDDDDMDEEIGFLHDFFGPAGTGTNPSRP